MKNEELENKLRKDFAYMKFSDNHFDRVMLSDFKFAKGNAVAIYTRAYETYSPGLDQTYSGIVFTDGKTSSRILYNRVFDSAGKMFGPYEDNDNSIKKILSFDGEIVKYKVESGKEKETQV